MARKSHFEEWIDLASMLPWQVSLGIAGISYFAFHHFSLTPPPTTPGQIGQLVFIGASAALQYIAPMIFTCGALFSFIHARRKRDIFESQTDLRSIRALSWQEFEWLVSEAYRRKGYSVVERGGSKPDGGVDLELFKNGRKSIVQCKRWNAMQINVSLVREAYGVMIAEGADECIFVASGKYTRDALRFAKGKPMQLIEGSGLLQLIKDIKALKLSAVTTESVHNSSVPTCPDCGSLMVSRFARRGPRAGLRFWGCSRYPDCFGKRPA